MARKYDLISELYNRTCKTVVSNPQNWQAFLASACRNYKLRYDEQLLVYAQRPDATAVLEIEQWNKIFGRWVNRGARGIAVFADENRSRQRLTHFVPDDKKSGGAYLTHSGIVKKIDEFERKLIMQDETVIPTEQISVIQGEMFKGLYE